MDFVHSPERDKEIFSQAAESDDEFVLELLAIAKKWRSKAMMRQMRIDELEKGS